LSDPIRHRARVMEKIDTHNDVETALYAVRRHLVNMAS
jgi:DNA-binding CsgD family transcriptional regulator